MLVYQRVPSYCYPIASIASTSAARARSWTGCVAERQMLVAATSRWCSCMRKAWNTSRQRIAGEDERWWTIPELEIFMGKSTINGGFSIAMFEPTGWKPSKRFRQFFNCSLGWGGVGWGNNVTYLRAPMMLRHGTFTCTCAHTSCYVERCVTSRRGGVGWGGVGWGGCPIDQFRQFGRN